VKRSNPSIITIIDLADEAVKNVKRCDGSVVGAEACGMKGCQWFDKHE
jgi:hypothetical protein